MTRPPLLTPNEIMVSALQTREALARLPDEPGVRELLIRYLIEGSDVFLGIRPDGSLAIIKGAERVDLIASGMAGSPPIRFTAAHMRSDTEADHFRRFYGDEADPMRSSSPNRVFVLREE